MASRAVARGFNAYKRTANLEELLQLQADAAAVEGYCKAQLAPEAYERVKGHERTTYRDPSERLDFWLKVEAGIKEQFVAFCPACRKLLVAADRLETGFEDGQPCGFFDGRRIEARLASPSRGRRCYCGRVHKSRDVWEAL